MTDWKNGHGWSFEEMKVLADAIKQINLNENQKED